MRSNGYGSNSVSRPSAVHVDVMDDSRVPLLGFEQVLSKSEQSYTSWHNVCDEDGSWPVAGLVDKRAVAEDSVGSYKSDLIIEYCESPRVNKGNRQTLSACGEA